MRVVCHLREIRGDRSLRELEDESGINRAQLSLIERGRLFPADKDKAALEGAYGAPAHDWYPREVLLFIQDDPGEAEST